MRKSTNDIAFAIVTETAEAMNTAQAMIRDAEVAAIAKRTAQKHTNCRACQAELENFLIDFPDASEDAILGSLQDAWETCGACAAEYNAHLERQAEASQYCELDAHCFNGDDIRWQNGGAK